MAPSGRYLPSAEGVDAFHPDPLPPEIKYDGTLLGALSRADRSLGRLDGVSEMILNPDLFVMMYIRKEAVLSSQIEGTQASLQDVLEFESEVLKPDESSDVEDVVNYIAAMNHGMGKVKGGGEIDLELIMEMHSILMKNVRGGELAPGKIRRTQNWIGPPGSEIGDAFFIPPSPDKVEVLLNDLCSFINSDMGIAPLIKVGLAHCQFETVHPFLDGNGRIGRLLITLLLTREGYLKKPLLYLSHYFKRMQFMYYSRLQAVRDEGNWEDWLKFFLNGVYEVSQDSYEKIIEVSRLREKQRKMIMDRMGNNSNRALMLLDELLKKPYQTVNTIGNGLNLSFPNANKLASRLEEIGILKETTGQKRNRIFEYSDYIRILEG